MSMEGLSDRELLDAYVAKASDAAFAELVRRYIGLVYSAAARQVGERQAAEDVTQAVFIVLARKCGTLRRDVVLGAWLYNATRLAALDCLKIAARREKHERAAVAMRADPPNESASCAEMLAYLDEGLARLGAKDRSALVMRFFREQSMKEVGQALGVSENTATMRVGRAVEKLRVYFSRKGIVVPAAAVVALMTAEAARGVPPGLAATLSQVAVSAPGAAGAAAGSAAGSAAGQLIAKGVVAAMTAAKTKAISITVIAVILMGTTVYLVSQELVGGAGKQKKVERVETNVAVPPKGKPAAKTPRKLFSTIGAASYDESSGVKDYGPIVGSLVSGSWLRYNSFDFGPGATTFGALVAVPPTLAGRKIEIRLDSLNGPLAGVLTIKGTAGWTDFVYQETPVSGAAGVHDVYLVVSEGQHVGNLTSFRFTRKLDASEVIAAADFRASKATLSTRGVVLRTPADWVSYGPVDFGTGVKSITVEMVAMKEGMLEIYLDGMERPPLAGFPLSPGQSAGDFMAQTAEIEMISGPHDVFIKLVDGDGPVTIRRLKFGR